MLGMLLLVQGAGHLMFIISLPITIYSPPAGYDRDVITGVSSYYASQGTDHYIYFGCSLTFETPFCMLFIVFPVQNTN